MRVGLVVREKLGKMSTSIATVGSVVIKCLKLVSEQSVGLKTRNRCGCKGKYYGGRFYEFRNLGIEEDVRSDRV